MDWLLVAGDIKSLIDSLIDVPLAAHLQFLSLRTTSGVTTQMLNRGDDEYSSPINIPGGFPFANSTETVVHVRVVLYAIVYWILAM